MEKSALGTVADIQMGQSPPGNTYNQNGYGLPFFQGTRDFNYRFPSSRVYCSAPTRIANPGDILLSIRAPIGRINIASEKCATGRGIAVIKPNAIEDARYIEYALLNMNPFWNTLESGGSVFGNAKRSDLENLLVPWPSKNIRNKIAAILSAYDDLIENNLRRIKILEEMAQNLYREWFVNFRFPGYENTRFVDSPLGEIPEGWEVDTVEKTFTIFGGGTPSKKVDEYWKNGVINWYTPSDLTSAKNLFMDESNIKITENGLKKSSAKLFPAFSVMMTSRATLGVVSINTKEACTNQGFITCIPNEKFPLFILYFWLKENVNKIINLASGSTFKEITKSVFKTIELIVPSSVVTKHFENFIKNLGYEILYLQRKNHTLRQTRDLLLPKLISGEVDVSDLDIELPGEVVP